MSLLLFTIYRLKCKHLQQNVSKGVCVKIKLDRRIHRTIRKIPSNLLFFSSFLGDKELKKADGGKDLWGIQHPRCVNMIKRSDWPARCSCCHAIDSSSKSRCNGIIVDKKSIYCDVHKNLDSNGSNGS